MAKQTEETVQEKKKCFVITPIGDPGTETRRKADGVIDAVITPVVADLGFELIIPHKMTNLGSITQQVLEHILNDDLVIANLTGLNANVMYELATRHAVRKPIVCIIEEGTPLPFDITTERTIFYDDDMFGVEKLKKSLTDIINSAMIDEYPSNPIYRAKADFAMQQTIIGDKDKYIIDKLELLDNQLRNMQTYIYNNGPKRAKLIKTFKNRPSFAEMKIAPNHNADDYIIDDIEYIQAQFDKIVDNDPPI